MDSRIFAPSIRPPRAPRHEAGSIPRHLVPCRYFARGYCGRGDSCMFSHSYNTIQSRGCLSIRSLLHRTHRSIGSQSNRHTVVPFRNNYTSEFHFLLLDMMVWTIMKASPPQSHAGRHYEIRHSSLSPHPIIVPQSSPSSSVTTPDEASPPFNLYSPVGSSPMPSTIITDIAPAGSTLAIPTRASITANGDTSCDEFYKTRSDVARDEFLSPSTDVHFAEFCPLTSRYPNQFTPVPYVQRGFGYRDNSTRNRDNRRRRRKVKM